MKFLRYCHLHIKKINKFFLLKCKILLKIDNYFT